jgi:hypothetical protein
MYHQKFWILFQKREVYFKRFPHFWCKVLMNHPLLHDYFLDNEPVQTMNHYISLYFLPIWTNPSDFLIHLVLTIFYLVSSSVSWEFTFLGLFVKCIFWKRSSRKKFESVGGQDPYNITAPQILWKGKKVFILLFFFS